MSSHDPIFGTNKNRVLKNGSLKTDRVNGPFHFYEKGSIGLAPECCWGFTQKFPRGGVAEQSKEPALVFDEVFLL